MNIGLLMIADESDVLERTLTVNSEFVDVFYVLDGTVPNDESEAICASFFKCKGYWRDSDLHGDRFGYQPRDGWRQFLYERAVSDVGADNWFLLLHGDEVWTGLPDSQEEHDSFLFALPFFFPRAGEPWDDTVNPLDQLRWSLGPGYPELRMFHGGKNVRYADTQHFNVRPAGLTNTGWCDKPILHYLYRSPASQNARAARHEETGFDPDNYRHILDERAVYWTDEMIADRKAREHGFFRDLSCSGWPVSLEMRCG